MSGVRATGFTLLEVLIALAVLALAMGATIKAAGEYTGNQAYLRDRTLATWVARNVLVQYQLDGAWPEVGERKGSMEMGRREWEWRARFSQTEEAALRRMDVEVGPLESEDEVTIALLSGFLRKPEKVVSGLNK
ncbi:MAG: type II secretion system minor pseudopilin GspI [Gammaproteobacteria bacterium]